MALSANALPSNPPLQIAPFDAELCFATNQAAETKAVTGYFGAPKQIDIGQGRREGYWAIAMTAMVQNDGDESYTFYLLGSNDVAWGNGNVEILDAQNFGGATGRSIATIVGATPAVPPSVGPAGTMNIFPFSNMKSLITYRYLRCYVVIAGTTPSVTANTWITYDAC